MANLARNQHSSAAMASVSPTRGSAIAMTTVRIPLMERSARMRSTVITRVGPISSNATIPIAFHRCGVVTALKIALTVLVSYFLASFHLPLFYIETLVHL